MTLSQKLSLWLVFPHQLFDQLPEGVETVAVMEEPLFFQQTKHSRPAKAKAPKAPKSPKTAETPKSPIEKKKGKGKKP